MAKNDIPKIATCLMVKARKGIIFAISLRARYFDIYLATNVWIEVMGMAMIINKASRELSIP